MICKSRFDWVVFTHRQLMTLFSEKADLPPKIEAALQFLRHTQEILSPQSFDSSYGKGRALSKTEFEVKDSALTVLLEYFH